MKSFLKRFVCVMIILTMSINAIPCMAADITHSLQDIILLSNEIPAGWGITKLYQNETYNGNPSAKLTDISADIAVRNWNTTDISAYVNGGSIRFFAKADKEASLSVGLWDSVSEMRTPRNITVSLDVANYGELTEDWTEIAVPLSDFATDKLDMTNIWKVTLTAKGTVWINSVMFTSPDSEKNFPIIKYNQVGYKPNADKVAVVSGYKDYLDKFGIKDGTKFSIVGKNSGKTFFSGKLQLVNECDSKYSGDEVFYADFTEFKRAGSYCIKVYGATKTFTSKSFKISKTAYNTLLKDVSRYYFYQRSGMKLDAKYAGKWARDILFEDTAVPYLSDRTKTRDVSGGWFDAGDFGKYVDPGCDAVSDLLWSYLCFPEKFGDKNNIPESGNGVPDILDEIKYEIDFILKMQDSSSGGFYHRVKPDDETRAIVDTFGGEGDIKPSATTANATAVLAFASVIYKDFDSAYSKKLLKAAQKGWKYVESTPWTDSTGAYESKGNTSSVLWAAASLYYATGKSAYNTYVKAHYSDFADCFTNISFGHNNGNMATTALFTYLLCPKADSTVKAWISERFTEWQDYMNGYCSENPWKTALPYWALWWGSNGTSFTVTQDMYIGEKLLFGNTENAEKLSSSTLDFVLGTNPMRICMVSGEGPNASKQVYSGIFGSDGIVKMPRGYMPGGLNMYEGAILSQFPAKCYMDSYGEWVSSENAIYYESALLFNVALNA